MLSDLKHIENKVGLRLVCEQQQMPDGERVNTRKQFNAQNFMVKYSKHLMVRNFFNDVTDKDYRYSLMMLDTWIRDRFKGTELLQAYLTQDVMPAPTFLQQELPKTYKVFWDILTKVNQNRMCKFYVLKEPIPGFSDLNLSLFAGYKVLGPFTSETKKYYKVLELEGSRSTIDKFLKTLDSL